jgi:hypothetical protein
MLLPHRSRAYYGGHFEVIEPLASAANWAQLTTEVSFVHSQKLIPLADAMTQQP